MLAGLLRHRVTFQTSTITRNDYGEPIPDWADIETVWARMEPTAGKEKFAAMHQQSEIDYRITCRYQSALSSLSVEDRVTWNSKTFDIKSVINVEERNRELHVFIRLHS